MKATQLLHDLGQSLWLDNITRDLLNSGTLKLGSLRIRRSSITPLRTALRMTRRFRRSY
jgi:hypothetical protein